MKIKKILTKIDKNLLVIFLCVTVMLSQLFTHGIIEANDIYIHFFRIIGMAQNIIHGNFLSKIAYNYINGFGYGTGIFYPQLNLLLPSIIYIIIRNVSIAIKIYIYFNTLLSGIVMYVFLKQKVSNANSALIGSLLYILAPYAYIQSMFQADIGETALFLSLPLVFLGLDRIFERKKYGNLFVIAGGVYILQSHVLSALLVLIFVIIYLLLSYKKTKNIRVILDLLQSFFIILLLSIYFIIPFIEHYKLHLYNATIVSNTISDNITHFTQLVFNLSNTNDEILQNDIPYIISYIIVGIILTLPHVYNRFKNNDKSESLKFLILGIISIIMILWPDIYKYTRYIYMIKFSWRLLPFCIFFLAVTATYIFNYYKIDNKLFPIIIFIIIIISFAQINSYIVNTRIKSNPGIYLNKEISEQLIDDPNNITIPKSMGNNEDYLPKQCNIKYIASRGNELIAKKGNLSVSDYTFKNGKISANVKVENSAKVELPLIYYLGYNITIDNQRIEYYKNKNGFMEINLNNIDGKLKVSYTGTRLDIIANIISLVSIIGVFTYYIYSILKIKGKKNEEN